MHGGANPLAGALAKGMWQIYRLARPGGNRQIAAGGPCELRTMARPASNPSDDVTVYLVLNDYRTGLAFVETALEEADLETVIRNFLSGWYSDALRVVAFMPPKARPGRVGRCRPRGARSSLRRRRYALRGHQALY
jgi:hypothetical protein